MAHATHFNAALSLRARLRLAQLIVDHGWPPARAAERYDVSRKTAAKWTARYRAQGTAGMLDRSSAPHRQPCRTRQRGTHPSLRARASRGPDPRRCGELGKVPDGVGWRNLGRATRGQESCRDSCPHWCTQEQGQQATDRTCYLHTVIDDHSPLAWVEAQDDETKEIPTAVVRNAVAVCSDRQCVLDRRSHKMVLIASHPYGCDAGRNIVTKGHNYV